MVPSSLVHIPDHATSAFSWTYDCPGLLSSHLFCSETVCVTKLSLHMGRGVVCTTSHTLIHPRREKQALSASPSVLPLGM